MGTGIVDGQDAFANGPRRGQDGDGVPDTLDEDDDNDGWSDVQERQEGTSTVNADSDGDGLIDTWTGRRWIRSKGPGAIRRCLR